MEKALFIEKIKLGFWLMSISLIIGIIIANLFFTGIRISFESKRNFWDVLIRIGRSRISLFLVAFIVSFTRLRHFVMESMLIFFGFSLGFTESIFAMDYAITRYIGIACIVLSSVFMYLVALCGVFSTNHSERPKKPDMTLVIMSVIFCVSIIWESVTYFFILPKMV